jgi:hypothetical protein
LLANTKNLATTSLAATHLTKNNKNPVFTVAAKDLA